MKICQQDKEYRKENSDKFFLFNNIISFLLKALALLLFYINDIVFLPYNISIYR